MKLILVESPTKSNTLQKILGGNYKVLASYGHVRDLPEKSLGVDLEHNFEPKYVILPKAKKRVAELNSETKKATEVILATDEDREGEAIAWHLVQALNLNKLKNQKSKVKSFERIVFHEITENAIKEALKNPRDINMKLVDAQQARRILDRLVGYKLSPFLWKKVAKGLSAGRVQSVAVRLVAEREKEILNFKPEEHWTITARLKTHRLNNAVGQTDENKFEAQLVKIGEKKLEKFSITNKEAADEIVSGLDGAAWQVLKIEKKEVRRRPLPPFTTSTLQQTAWAWFGFGAKQTMLLAQQLYETGLITYMRTDSFNLSKESIAAAFEKIKKDFGNDYLATTPRIYKIKSKTAQEAHEAIRPTEPNRDPKTLKEKLMPQQYKLYDLIWRRFIAGQMSNAIFEATGVDVLAANYKLQTANCIFRATGNVLRFDGFLKVYPQKLTETSLPVLKEKEDLELKELMPAQHFTEPPPRYNEASLIKTLEEYGIGRPSTYAPTMATIQTRRYVIKDEQKRLKPTDIGTLVNDILVEHFPEVVDIKFTARMEEDLDKIAGGGKEWRPVIKEFWEPFKKNLDKKSSELSKEKIAMEKTELKCPECGKDLVIRMSRYGKFYACSGFPKCKYTAPLEPKEKPEDLGHCHKCETGQIVKRHTKKGRAFWGCSNWPKCDWATWENPKKNELKEIDD